MDHPQGPDARPAISVVIPCRNEARTIVGVLDAVARQDISPDEIVIVDDGSVDDTMVKVSEWAQRRVHPFLIVLRGQGRGPAAAMNAGIEAARGDVIIRLDGHCRPRPDYIRRALATLDRPDAGVVGGVWEIEPGAPTSVARAIAAVVSHPIGSGGAAYRTRRPADGEVKAVDTVPFGCYRRDLWAALGGYDESLISNEDFDFNHRARRAGFEVVINSDIRSTYGARPTLRELGRQYFRYGYWKTQMLKKSPEALRLRQLPPALVLPWICATVLLAVTVSGVGSLLAAALYPALIAVAVMHIARTDLRLMVPAFAAILIQHSAWSAGFWHGMLYPAEKTT